MARAKKLLAVGKALGKGALGLAKSTPLGMVTSGLAGAAGGFIAGRMTAKGGKKRRRTTPAKLINRIRIFQLKKKLAQVRGY